MSSEVSLSATPIVTPLPRVESFGNYRLTGRLGVGGTATVFLGHRRDDPAPLAIKRLHPHLTENEEPRRAFAREASILSMLDHPSIAQVLDFGVVESYPYLVTSYYEGLSLQQLLQRLGRTQRPLPLDAFSTIFTRIAEALHYAHDITDERGDPLNLIHRDVSPQNVYLSLKGDVLLLDFGLGRMAGQTVTRSGIIKGKIPYMSPEQVQGEPALDRRTDLFSLGVVAWESLTRRRLFRKETDMLSLLAVTEGEIPSVRRFDPSVPEAVCDLVDKAVSRDPDKRFQSGEQFAFAVRSAIPEPAVPGDVRLAALLQLAFPELNRPVPRPDEATIGTLPDTALTPKSTNLLVDEEQEHTLADTSPADPAGQWQGWEDDESGTLNDVQTSNIQASVTPEVAAQFDAIRARSEMAGDETALDQDPALPPTVEARARDRHFDDPASQLPFREASRSAPYRVDSLDVVERRQDPDRFPSHATDHEDLDALEPETVLPTQPPRFASPATANDRSTTAAPVPVVTPKAPVDVGQTRLLNELPEAPTNPPKRLWPQRLAIAFLFAFAFALGLWARGLGIVQTWLSGS